MDTNDLLWSLGNDLLEKFFVMAKNQNDGRGRNFQSSKMGFHGDSPFFLFFFDPAEPGNL